MLYLTSQPLWVAALVLVALPTFLAMAGTIFIRRYVGLEKLSTNNEVAGFKFATIGVLYAVLLAFAVIVVWEKFSDAEESVAREAGAATTIYRLSAALGEPSGSNVRDSLSLYLKSAANDDWPAMEKGGPSRATTEALDRAYAALLAFHPNDRGADEVFGEILHELDGVTEARRDRLVHAAGVVPTVIWFALFGGAILTVAFTFFFGTENLRAQALMTGALTALIFAGLLTIVTIDRPFTGSVHVTPEALIRVLDDFAGAPRS